MPQSPLLDRIFTLAILSISFGMLFLVNILAFSRSNSMYGDKKTMQTRYISPLANEAHVAVKTVLHASDSARVAVNGENADSRQASHSAKTSRDIRIGIIVEDYKNAHVQIASLEDRLNTRFSSVSIYKHFGLPVNRDILIGDLEYIQKSNKKLYVAWEPWNPQEGMKQSVDYLSEIPKGMHDQYLQSFAESLRQYAGPVVVRFGHEMNGNWYPWGNRPAEYIASYRYIVDYFKKQNVSNVQWMWSINAENVPHKSFAAITEYYPGDTYVDVIGIDGFNFGATREYGWKSFEQIFSAAYLFISSTYTKPIIISETASSENGGNKAAWVRDMLQVALPYRFPKVQEVVWFNLLKEADWRIESTDSSLQSFKNNL